MTTIDDVAVETGREADDVLATARSLGLVVSSIRSGLSSDEHRRLRAALGADDLPPVVAGSTAREPGGAAAPEVRSLRERADALAAEAAHPRRTRVDAKKLTRFGIMVFVLVAVAAGVVSLMSRAEPSIEDVTRFTADDVGSCFDFDSESRGGLAPTPCDAAHDAELFSVFDSQLDPSAEDAAPFPGRASLTDEADAGCRPAFADYVGAPAETIDELSIVYLLPTEETWPLGDRTIHCFVEATAGRLEGSMAGAASS